MQHQIKGSILDIKEALSKSEAKQKEIEERQRKLFIGGLPKNLKDSYLYEYFRQFGPLQKAYVVKDYKTGNTRGFGFVIFKDYEGYKKALHWPMPHMIDGKDIHVRETQSRKEEKEKQKPGKPRHMYGAYEDDRTAYVYDQPNSAFINYPHYGTPTTSSVRPGVVNYQTQPIYYAAIPETFVSIPTPETNTPPTYFQSRPFQMAPQHYNYAGPEGVLFIAAPPQPPQPPANMHFRYQPATVYRVDPQAYYQTISTPQIDSRIYRGPPVYVEQVPVKIDQPVPRPLSHFDIKRHVKSSNIGIIYSEKNIQETSKELKPKNSAPADLMGNQSQKEIGQTKTTTFKSPKISKKLYYQKSKDSEHLEQLEEDVEEDDEMERVHL